jgi:hypothetical protein
MFEQETVFILGAGASWHYGYPTGEDLVKLVIAKAGKIIEYLSYREEGAMIDGYFPTFIERLCPNNEGKIRISLEFFGGKCTELKNRLQIVNPPVIDSFLRDNEPLRDIGKFFIALVIKECEIKYKKQGNLNRKPDERQNAKDDWIRFIIHQLLSPRKDGTSNLLENKVSFITFNYDTSLEDKIREALLETHVAKGNCNNFCSGNRFIHIYGKINSETERRDFSAYNPNTNIWVDMDKKVMSQEFVRKLTANKELLDYCWELATTTEPNKGIKTIGGVDKHENQEAINAAKEKIQNAKDVYILGYGFDEANNALIGLESLGKVRDSSNPVRVMFTNFNDSNRINKKAGKLFLNDESAFYLKSTAVNSPHYYEKSTRNVYDAFADDFDAI